MNAPIKHQLKQLESRLKHGLLKDRYLAQRKIQAIHRRVRNNQPVDNQLTALHQLVERSCQLFKQRSEKSLELHYPEELPVSQKRNEIIQAIFDHQVIVICGETGSGKTTQLPKMCLQAGLGVRGMIGHTQPRRLAARSVASRIADELKQPLGDTVGFKVRFNDSLSDLSQIKLMTDGILLSEIHHDPYLNQYDCIIVDEAHERSLNIDFLLGYLKQLCHKRKELKIIITSATIDPQRFSRHFNNAPVIEVSGRTYPVEVEYRDTFTEEGQQTDLPAAIADCVDEITRRDRGDILVFLSGERDIRKTADYLSKQNLQNTEILPLLARLSASEQNRIFSPSSSRRIVLATNVAETSLTVPGIKYVIDTGLARISRYSWRSKIQRLPIEKISQASANQRKGRCGRVSAGVCYRLYSEDDFKQRPEFTEPEIQRTNLASVILTMEHLQLGHVEDFPFVEPPDSKLINDGYKLLFELGAINKQHKISDTGRILARLPIDPKLGRILIEAEKENCIQYALIVVSALAVQDPRERPIDQQQAADEAHKKFADNRSDFVSWINLWQQYHQNKQELSGNRLRKWCKQNFISWLRMREWIDTHSQIRNMLKELNYKINETEFDYSALHRSLLTGFLSQLGFKDENHEYLSCRQRRFHIFPGSDLFNHGPKWVVASDIVETQKVYARHLAKIDPAWISDKAQHMIKHNYANPHWEKKSAQVSATRKSTLLGLLVNPGVRVHYGPINPRESRDIFIRQALIEGDFDCRHNFFKHNHSMIESIEALEAKSRRQDILVDQELLFEFYDRHIPDTVYSGATLDKWLKKNNDKALYLSESDLMQHDASNISSFDFPDQLTINQVQFPLEYHFDPSHHCDGITLITPASAIGVIDPQLCDWLVPGLRLEKMTEMIRSLPKQLRKNFVPAPDFAAACLDALSPNDGMLASAMAQHLRKITGTDIPYDAWQTDNVADYLFLNFRVIDGKGKTLAESRDLAALQTRFSDYQAKDNQTSLVTEHLEQDNVSSDILDSLSEQVDIEQQGFIIKAYPALSVKDKQVNLRIFTSPQEAAISHHAGLRQLFMNALSQQVRHLESCIPDAQSMCLQFTPIGNCKQLKSELISRLIDHLFTQHAPASRQQFDEVLDAGKAMLDETLKHLSKHLKDILASFHRIHKQLKSPPLHLLDAMADIQDQLDHLLPRHFILETRADDFEHLSRYLRGIEKRLEKIQSNPERDRQSRLQVQPFWDDYKQRSRQLEQQNRHSEQLLDFRWMIEEFRISLFAQEIRTRAPVSAKRLKKVWSEISDA